MYLVTDENLRREKKTALGLCWTAVGRKLSLIKRLMKIEKEKEIPCRGLSHGNGMKTV
jgi:hypothetical protein